MHTVNLATISIRIMHIDYESVGELKVRYICLSYSIGLATCKLSDRDKCCSSFGIERAFD